MPLLRRSRVNESRLSPDRILQAKRSRFNPLRGLTPERLAHQLDSFNVGYLREMALTWDAIERRDYILKIVAPKRKKAVARHGWEILMVDDSPEAAAHKEALEIFYNNVTATDALNENERGGFSLLVRQMMDAIGKKYAVHEIVWQPQADTSAPGRTWLTATFRFCPLWFFEATTSRLRFLTTEASTDGIPMNDGEWLVTVGDGIMEACSVCYVYKGLSLKDWIGFNEKFGIPVLHLKTDAAKGSKEWNDMVEAGQDYLNNLAVVTSRSDEITLIEVSKAGDVPFQPLVDKMDQANTALWRGGDLGTTSKKDHAGASLQSDETGILEQDDAALISETLNLQVDRYVIEYQFGVKPLAYIKILTSKKQDVPAELQIDQFLLSAGAPISIENALERYGREMPKDGEALLTPIKAAPTGATGGANAAPAGPALENSLRVSAPGAVSRTDREKNPISAELLKNSLAALAKASMASVQPISTRLAAIMQMENTAQQRGALILLKAELPTLIPDAPAQIAKTLENIISAALWNGIATGAAETEAK